jgi:hypothetical protein
MTAQKPHNYDAFKELEVVEARSLPRPVLKHKEAMLPHPHLPAITLLWTDFVRHLHDFNNPAIEDRQWKQDYQAYASQYLECSRVLIGNPEEVSRTSHLLEDFEKKAMGYRDLLHSGTEQQCLEALPHIEEIMHQVLLCGDQLINIERHHSR